jgi:hypothetical protein
MKSYFLAALILVSASAAAAHELEKGPNGGQLVDIPGHHVELVISGTSLVLFLSDEKERPVSSQGIQNARAIVQESGKTLTVPLASIAPNKLGGQLAQPLTAGARIVVSATMVDGKTIQARFVRR